jgi:hypothetical protein
VRARPRATLQSPRTRTSTTPSSRAPLEIFTLRRIEGLELNEVAAALGMSLATTKRHLAKVTARVHALAMRDPLLSEYLDGAAPSFGEEDDDA